MREFEFEEGMVVHFSRVPGTNGYDSAIDFTDSTAAVRGLAIITKDVAKRLGVPVENVLCKLATVLIRPEAESQTVGKEHNPSAPAGHLPLHKGGFGERIATASAMLRNDGEGGGG